MIEHDRKIHYLLLVLLFSSECMIGMVRSLSPTKFPTIKSHARDKSGFKPHAKEVQSSCKNFLQSHTIIVIPWFFFLKFID